MYNSRTGTRRDDLLVGPRSEADFTFVHLRVKEFFPKVAHSRFTKRSSSPQLYAEKVCNIQEMCAAERTAWDLYGLSRYEFAYLLLVADEERP
ncbi:hypothetical protein BN946_scf184805.g30 [Trametes cinnabarina]|uniref:Uncharacterized protein n=1 Tax=Pycnoporus cinnabarinus TaxID=5643 RepID=A0A060S3V4_PYCCI|nr:hypothetical protein BN946_scf184805.g30 [Trametes cinnabarina]